MRNFSFSSTERWGRIALLRTVPAWHGGLGFLPFSRVPTGTSALKKCPPCDRCFSARAMLVLHGIGPDGRNPACNECRFNVFWEEMRGLAPCPAPNHGRSALGVQERFLERLRAPRAMPLTIVHGSNSPTRICLTPPCLPASAWITNLLGSSGLVARTPLAWEHRTPLGTARIF